MTALEYHTEFNKFFAKCVRTRTTFKNRHKLIAMYDRLNELRVDEGIEPLELPSLDDYRDNERMYIEANITSF